VILTGGIKTPENAERLLVKGKADLIGVGRAMLKNAAWGAELCV
jgi:2,4-dienoyl-CoA reductase-like NADH-dependent reductase (Old Yellow Enzyme family)